MMVFGCVFALFPLVITIGVMDCGAKVLPYVLIILGCPLCMYTCGRRTQAKNLAKPDGMLEQVDEQRKQMAMTGPIGAVPQNCASLPASVHVSMPASLPTTPSPTTPQMLKHAYPLLVQARAVARGCVH
jgi:hypothetical protein